MTGREETAEEAWQREVREVREAARETGLPRIPARHVRRLAHHKLLMDAAAGDPGEQGE